MLRIEIIDDECGEDEAHIFKVPMDTPWFKIEAAVSLLYPTTTCVSIIVEDAVEE